MDFYEMFRQTSQVHPNAYEVLLTLKVLASVS